MAVVTSIFSRLPAFWSLLKKSMPGWKLSSEPPDCTAAMPTAAKAAPACVGSPFMATAPLYAGLRRSDSWVGAGYFDESYPMDM